MEEKCLRDRHGYVDCQRCAEEDCGPEDIKRAEEIDKAAREYNTGWPTTN